MVNIYSRELFFLLSPFTVNYLLPRKRIILLDTSCLPIAFYVDLQNFTFMCSYLMYDKLGTVPNALFYQVGDKSCVRFYPVRERRVPLHADRAQAHPRQHGAQG